MSFCQWEQPDPTPSTPLTAQMTITYYRHFFACLLGVGPLPRKANQIGTLRTPGSARSDHGLKALSPKEMKKMQEDVAKVISTSPRTGNRARVYMPAEIVE